MTEPTATPETTTLYITSWCPDCRRAVQFFESQRIPHVKVDIDRDSAAAGLVMKMNRGNRSVPTIIFPDGSVLVEPSTAQLAQKAASLQSGRGAA